MIESEECKLHRQWQLAHPNGRPGRPPRGNDWANLLKNEN